MDSMEQQLDTLIGSDEDDVLSLLGVQAEFVEIAEQRGANRTPEWSDDETFQKVFGAQRAPASERKKYKDKGKSFVDRFLASMKTQVHQALCDGKEPQKEVAALKSDFRGFVKHVAIAISTLLLRFLPPWLAVAAVSIGTSIAVLFWKGLLDTFCAI
jgi:hypothetical protein